MKFDKLVRDKIPEIIAKDGKIAVTRILDDEEFKCYLERKLDEEVAEFHDSKSMEELADILEVVFALGRARGYSAEALYARRIDKCVERGGFTKKILLEEIRYELKPCPQCGEVPEIGYACGEYFVFHPLKVVGTCVCSSFTEMHSSEELEAEAWNRRAES